MTNLLQRAITEIEKLPAEEQDAIAKRLLFELADEHAWETRFRATRDQQWDRLADAVRYDIAAGDAVPLEDVFPPGASQP